MKAEYMKLVRDLGYDDPEVAMAQCVVATGVFVKRFPNLRIAKGIVWSKTNPDNYTKYEKQYLHQWCVDRKTGEIVDPTVSQYCLIGEVIYEEKAWSTAKSCMGCGRYHPNRGGYCGECEWSEEDGN